MNLGRHGVYVTCIDTALGNPQLQTPIILALLQTTNPDNKTGKHHTADGQKKKHSPSAGTWGSGVLLVLKKQWIGRLTHLAVRQEDEDDQRMVSEQKDPRSQDNQMV